MSGDPTPFEVCGPLPTGTTVLEASAGTGKTYTIAALATRYIAEGVVSLDQLMLVTFGRMATNELRLRVRERLVAVAIALGRAIQTGTPAAGGGVEHHLTDAAPGELEHRRERVARALADFDAATIATTHEFCLKMLDGLGVLGDREPQAAFVEHLSDLTREVATDLYLRRYAAGPGAPMTYAEALAVADLAVQAVHARLVPDGLDQTAPDRTDGTERVAFAEAVRAEVDRRKRAGRLFSYDDMLTRLRDALADPEHGAAAAGRLRQRFRVVMVDEFQDTDPVQWEILHRAFHGAATLILIGDPKQAIYAFRGADVYSYLDAVSRADRVCTLETNWRSDQALVDALESLIGGATLGEDEIVVRPVKADHQQRRLTSSADPGGGSTALAPIRLRVFPHPPDAETVPSVASLRPRITNDLVADVTALLASDAQVDHEDGPEPVQPADLAVLVRTNARGEQIRDALVAAGVPAVMHGASSVFGSPVAQDWLTLLIALDQPRQQAVRQAALTCFFGWTFARLAQANEQQEQALADLTQRVRWWGRLLASRGVAALLEAATADEGVPERLLATRGGERRLTDLRHIAQSLHAAQVAGQLGVGALVEWLRTQMAGARGLGSNVETRRLETDARAVTILTVHRSKGLEFPVVYLPEAWDRHVNDRDEGRTLRLHQPDRTGADTCVLDVGGRFTPGRNARFDRYRNEEAGEDLRLCYVALTRAKSQVVTWWAPSANTPSSALQRFLYRSVGDAPASPPVSYALQGDPFGGRSLGPGIALEPVTERSNAPWQPADPPGAALRARNFSRELDLHWRRTSYSSLTAAAHGVTGTVSSVGSEPEPSKEDDEASTALPGLVDPPPPAAVPAGPDPFAAPSPMQALPMGAAFGTLVHEVFELVDPVAADLDAEIHRACGLALARTPAEGVTVDELAGGLTPAYGTPLGPLASDRRLCDLPTADRLAELTFEFGLAGGDTTTAEVTVGMIGAVLRRQLPATDPLARYADALDDPVLAGQVLRGYLNGSIDAVLRISDAESPTRYLVVDYKTNWLGRPDRDELSVGDYTPARMTEAMINAHYPLQALLYSVALHRLLRWRQPGYDPDVHLGGIAYLFIRGMAGPDTPRVDGVPCGVFSWRPPGALVVELSDLLDGRRS
ncbi:MAG TPA: UvrD-helicase domain-containing protein [Propionibacteriaceae bacterium]|nr:UvrD-helicase domain-containing protein [Propionibacteriaceae bacterium]